MPGPRRGDRRLALATEPSDQFAQAPAVVRPTPETKVSAKEEEKQEHTSVSQVLASWLRQFSHRCASGRCSSWADGDESSIAPVRASSSSLRSARGGLESRGVRVRCNNECPESSVAFGQADALSFADVSLSEAISFASQGSKLTARRQGGIIGKNMPGSVPASARSTNPLSPPRRCCPRLTSARGIARSSPATVVVASSSGGTGGADTPPLLRCGDGKHEPRTWRLDTMERALLQLPDDGQECCSEESNTYTHKVFLRDVQYVRPVVSCATVWLAERDGDLVSSTPLVEFEVCVGHLGTIQFWARSRAEMKMWVTALQISCAQARWARPSPDAAVVAHACRIAHDDLEASGGVEGESCAVREEAVAADKARSLEVELLGQRRSTSRCPSGFRNQDGENAIPLHKLYAAARAEARSASPGKVGYVETDAGVTDISRSSVLDSAWGTVDSPDKELCRSISLGCEAESPDVEWIDGIVLVDADTGQRDDKAVDGKWPLRQAANGGGVATQGFAVGPYHGDSGGSSSSNRTKAFIPPHIGAIGLQVLSGRVPFHQHASNGYSDRVVAVASVRGPHLDEVCGETCGKILSPSPGKPSAATNEVLSTAAWNGEPISLHVKSTEAELLSLEIFALPDDHAACEVDAAPSSAHCHRQMVAAAALPLRGLMEGFRWVALQDPFGSSVEGCGLWVQVVFDRGVLARRPSEAVQHNGSPMLAPAPGRGAAPPQAAAPVPKSSVLRLQRPASHLQFSIPKLMLVPEESGHVPLLPGCTKGSREISPSRRRRPRHPDSFSSGNRNRCGDAARLTMDEYLDLVVESDDISVGASPHNEVEASVIRPGGCDFSEAWTCIDPDAATVAL